MDQDRELLELAAKAAGLTELTEWAPRITDFDSPHFGGPALHKAGTAGECQSWNPLTDDGDALRLARAMLIKIDFNRREVMFSRGDGAWETIGWHLDGYRGAIVRAAAEIGKQLSA